MTKPALLTLKGVLALSAWAAVASPMHVMVKASSAAGMADDNRISKSPLDLTLVTFDEMTRSQPRVTKMRRIEQANKFELVEYKNVRHCHSTRVACACCQAVRHVITPPMSAFGGKVDIG